MNLTKSQSAPPELELKFDGKTLKHLEPHGLSFEFVINQIPVGRVVLSRTGSTVGDRRAEASDASVCAPGSKIEIKVKQGAVLFSGWVVKQDLQWTEAGGVKIVLKFKHDLHQLTLVHRSDVFGGDKEISDADIVRAMLTKYKIKVGTLTGMAVKHAQMVQYQCTDWRFLKARLCANDVWLLPKVSGADVLQPKLAPKPNHRLDLLADDANAVLVEEVNWSLSVENQAAALKVGSWDIQQQKMAREASASLPNPIGKNGLDPAKLKTLRKEAWGLRHSTTMAPDEQAALANGRLLTQYSAGVHAKFTIWGTTQYELGQTLEVVGLGGHFNGTGLISGVSHKMEQGIWRTTICLGQDVAFDLDAGVVPGISGLHIGVVEAHKPDAKSWNRLRVVVPTLGLDNKPLWARFAAPYASKDSGVCFYPEKDDEVVLGFFENDPRYPVVLGAMHNPKNKAPFPPEQGKGRKGVIFEKDGQPKNSLNLLFKLEEKEVSLQSGEHQLAFGAQGVALATDSAKPISLKSKKGIKLDGGTEVSVKGKKVDLSN